MKFGDTYETTYTNRITGEKGTTTAIMKRAAWEDWHTNDAGNGLWRGDKQIVGTCDFTVAGCKNEKSAVAKIRSYIKCLREAESTL